MIFLWFCESADDSAPDRLDPLPHGLQIYKLSHMIYHYDIPCQICSCEILQVHIKYIWVDRAMIMRNPQLGKQEKVVFILVQIEYMHRQVKWLIKMFFKWNQIMRNSKLENYKEIMDLRDNVWETRVTLLSKWQILPIHYYIALYYT